MDAKILKAVKKITAAREECIRIAREVQTTCKHEHVVETEACSDSLGWKDGRRICVNCGLEEATRYGWPGETVDGGFYEFMRPAGKRTLLNSEFIKHDDVCKYRVHL